MYKLVRISTYFTSQAEGQRFFFIFGPPGVGKGTYSKMIKKDFQLNHISAGHLIKKFLKNPSPVFDEKVVQRAR
jgi:dephospho-CoA kinase